MGHKRRRFFGRKQAAILNALYHMNNEQRVALLRKTDLALVRYISECALNLLRGNVPLNKGHKARLYKHVEVLRKLADASTEVRSTKKIVSQHGGSFLPALLTPLLATILSNLAG